LRDAGEQSEPWAIIICNSQDEIAEDRLQIPAYLSPGVSDIQRSGRNQDEVKTWSRCDQDVVKMGSPGTSALDQSRYLKRVSKTLRIVMLHYLSLSISVAENDKTMMQWLRADKTPILPSNNNPQSPVRLTSSSIVSPSSSSLYFVRWLSLAVWAQPIPNRLFLDPYTIPMEPLIFAVFVIAGNHITIAHPLAEAVLGVIAFIIFLIRCAVVAGP
jgi:hypothetical protein